MRAGEYGDPSNLPALSSNLSALLTELTPIKDCMASPASTACTGGAGSQSHPSHQILFRLIWRGSKPACSPHRWKYNASCPVFMLADNLREM